MARVGDTFMSGGATGALIRAFDWSKTPLGPVASWPDSLKSLVRVMLNSRHPMFLWWGPELIQIYNDAYLPSMGNGKHPAALSQRGKDCWPEAWPIIEPQIRDVMEHGKASWNENQLVPIFRNGRLEDVYWTYGYSPAFDDDGTIAGTLVVSTETTREVFARTGFERARKEAELAREELRGIFMQAPIAICILTGPEYLYTLANPACVALVGREVVGKTLLQAFTRREVAAYLPLLDKVYRTGETISIREAQLPLTNAQGLFEHLYIDFAYQAYRDTTLAIVGVMVIVNDVTASVLARKRVEQLVAEIQVAYRRADVAVARLDQMFRKSPVCIALLRTPAHIFELVNPACQKLMGERELLGTTVREALPKIEEQGYVEVLDRVYQTGETFVGNELPVRLRRQPDGPVEKAFATFTYEPFRDIAGAVEGISCFGVDVTEMVLARRRIESLAVQARAADLRKDEFLAMLGHELRNPLAPITAALKLINLRGHSRDDQEHKVIERQLKHVSLLVDDLPDVSRIAHGKIELHKQPVDVVEIIAKAIEMASPLVESRGHKVSIECPDSGLIVSGDPTRLSQIVANVLTNSAKYTPPHGHIWVSATRVGPNIEIRVKDNGIGIAPELLGKLFALFVQGPRSIERSEGGLGLGLALVKRLVLLHGGSVTAFSEGLNRGSEFVVQPPALERTRPLPSATDTRASGPAKKAKRLLIVDDNHDAANTLAEVLRFLGHEVEVAFDGPEALKTLEGFRPDVGLIDIGLPIMDAWKLARLMREQSKDQPMRLIAVTGYGQSSDRSRSAEAGFDAHLVKPVRLDELEGEVCSGAQR